MLRYASYDVAVGEKLIARNTVEQLEDLLETFRVVIVGGARQTGKTTLVNELLERGPGTRFTFDDEAVRQRAVEDPIGFVEALPRGASVAEYQRAGEPFLLAVKRRVDRDRSRGQLLLTGSASYLATRRPVETLAGRAGRLVLWPLSQGEQRGVHETFVARLFDAHGRPPTANAPTNRAQLMEAVLRGGFPEVVSEALTGRRRRSWYQSYVHDVVSREALRPLVDIRLEREMLTLLRLMAARSAQELIIAELARDAGLARETTANYVALLEALYLVQPLPAWATNATTRAKRHPKIHLVDTGLAAHLSGATMSDLSPLTPGRLLGPLLESFVVGELSKQATWSERDIALSHFRDRAGAEIDVIVEDRDSGAICGIEVKASATPTQRDARHLAYIRDRLGRRFTLGVVLHTGDVVLPLGDRLWAMPVSALWQDV